MAAASLPAAPSPGPAPSPAALLGPCIERVIAGASGRKYAKLRQDAQVRGGSVSAEAADVPACPAHMPSACSCTHPHAAFDMRTSTTHTRCSCVLSSHTRCMQSLLDKLDTLLVVQGAGPPAEPPAEPPAAQPAEPVPAPAPAEPASPPQQPEAAGEEEVEVSLQAGPDGQFKLTLSPSKLAAAAAEAGEAVQQHADPGHMPVSPASAAGGPAQRPFARRRTEAAPSRPGALHDGAARGAHTVGRCWSAETDVFQQTSCC